MNIPPMIHQALPYSFGFYLPNFLARLSVSKPLIDYDPQLGIVTATQSSTLNSVKSPHSVSLSPLLGRQPILFPVRVTSRVCVTASIFQGETKLLAFSGILLTYYHNTIAAEAVFFIWSHKQQKIEKLYTLNIGQFSLIIKYF